MNQLISMGIAEWKDQRKESPCILLENRLDPGDKLGILSKGLSEDKIPRLEIFEDNFSIIWGKPIQKNLGNGFSSAARKYVGTQRPLQAPAIAIYGP